MNLATTSGRPGGEGRRPWPMALGGAARGARWPGLVLRVQNAALAAGGVKEGGCWSRAGSGNIPRRSAGQSRAGGPRRKGLKS